LELRISPPSRTSLANTAIPSTGCWWYRPSRRFSPLISDDPVFERYGFDVVW